MLWHIGNTTVRTPYRLREALLVLQGTVLNGNLHGKTNENAFAELLNDSGIVDIRRLNANEITKVEFVSTSVFPRNQDINSPGKPDVSDLGRKWRSALSQLGFITYGQPLLLSAATREFSELSGRNFEITPNGHRLIAAELIAAQQECFLRSMLAYRIPSPIEPRYKVVSFNPLEYVIRVMMGLENFCGDSYLAFEEFALFIQISDPEQGLETIVERILGFRNEKVKNTGHLKAFYQREYKAAVIGTSPDTPEDKWQTKSQTLNDYADLSFRYLKATGLFRAKGHGITLNPLKERLTKLIVDTPHQILDDRQYLVNLWRGAELPSDNVSSATRIIADLVDKIKEKGAAVPDIGGLNDLELCRHILEQRLREIEEEIYSRDQAGKIDDIVAWIDALINKSAVSSSGDRISIPRGEAPAYFEWVIWRAFLAIDSLKNHPWECRRFQIDQDFLPVNTAPGNGPDLIMEFEDALLVVEVTFTRSSRQEAAEGEPVRRHVAKYAEEQYSTGKAVYGLFIALDIDSNTAHTFRMGDWYKNDDTKINLQIVPLTLEDFRRLLVWGKDRLSEMPQIIQMFLLRCRAQANQESPQWKRMISKLVEEIVRVET